MISAGLFLIDFAMTDTAMIFAAGLGTRLRPITDSIPKALAPAGGSTLLHCLVAKLYRAGIRHFVVNVHHLPNKIIDYIKEDPFLSSLHVYVSDESDLLRDTGGGIRFAENLVEATGADEFLVHNVDIVSDLDIAAFCTPLMSAMNFPPVSEGAKSNPQGLSPFPSGLADNRECISNTRASMLSGEIDEHPLAKLVVSQRKTSRYLLFTKDGTLAGWKNISTGEVKTPWQDIEPERCIMRAFGGIHLISRDIYKIFRDVDNSPEDYPLYDSERRLIPSSLTPLGEKFSIIDFYLRVAAKHHIYMYEPEHLTLIDAGKIDTLAEADSFLRRK